MLRFIFLSVFCFAFVAEAQTLRVASWGGAYQKAQNSAYFAFWRKKYGIKQYTYNGTWDAFVAGHENWDVVDVEKYVAKRACDEGLLNPIPEDGHIVENIAATQDFMAGSLLPCAVGHTVWSWMWVTRKGAYSDNQPYFIRDFFDTLLFPGKRGLRKDPRGTLEWSLLALGHPPERIYDLLSTEDGLNLAFQGLDRIKDAISWWQWHTDELKNDKEVTMIMGYYSMFLPQIKKQRLTPSWHGQIYGLDYWVLPKAPEGKSKNKRSLEFVYYATSPKRMARLSRFIPYAPTRESAKAHLRNPELIPAMDSFSKSLPYDDAWWGENLTRILPRFNKWAEGIGVE